MGTRVGDRLTLVIRTLNNRLISPASGRLTSSTLLTAYTRTIITRKLKLQENLYQCPPCALGLARCTPVD